MPLIFICRVLQFLIIVFTIKAATTFLSPSEYGKFAILTTYISFISMMVFNPVGMYITRHLHAWHNNNILAQKTSIHWLYIIITSLIAASITLIINDYGLIQLYSSNTYIFFFILLYGASITFNQTTIPYLNMFHYNGWFSLLTIMTVLMNIIFAIILVNIYSPSAETWLTANIISMTIFGFIGYLICKQKLGLSLDLKYITQTLTINTFKKIKPVFYYSWPIAVAATLAMFQTQGYKFILADNYGLDILGIFAAGYSICAGVFAGFESVLTTYFQPSYYHNISSSDKQGREKEWYLYAKNTIPLYVLMFFILVAYAPFLVKIMLGEKFHQAVDYVVWAAAIELIRVLINVLGLVAHAEKQPRLLVKPQLIGASFLAITFYCLTIYNFGIIGICIALCLSGIITFTALYYELSKNFIMRLPYYLISYSCLLAAAVLGIANLTKRLYDPVGYYNIIINLIIISMVSALSLIYIYKLNNKKIID